MILSKQDALSEAQAITATAVSANSIDLGPPNTTKRDVGVQAKPLWAHFFVNTTFVSGGASTLQARVINDGDPALGSPDVIIASAVIAKAALVAGYRFSLPIPPGIDERYLGADYQVGTANFTAGNISCYITNQPPEDTTAYKRNYVNY